jgi:hypothetical protein
MPSHLEYEACKNIAKLVLQQCYKASLKTNDAKNLSCNNVAKFALQQCCKSCLAPTLSCLATMLQSLSIKNVAKWMFKSLSCNNVAKLVLQQMLQSLFFTTLKVFLLTTL